MCGKGAKFVPDQPHQGICRKWEQFMSPKQNAYLAVETGKKNACTVSSW